MAGNGPAPGGRRRTASIAWPSAATGEAESSGHASSETESPPEGPSARRSTPVASAQKQRRVSESACFISEAELERDPDEAISRVAVIDAESGVVHGRDRRSENAMVERVLGVHADI